MGKGSFREVDDLYWAEYLMLMKAAALRVIDTERDIHLLAYMTEVAKSRKKVGRELRPVYKTFKDFFDYERRVDELMGAKEPMKISRIAEAVTQANSLVVEVDDG